MLIVFEGSPKNREKNNEKDGHGSNMNYFQKLFS